MADLVIKFADLASEPIGTGRDVTAEVLVTYTREVPLTNGTVLQPVPMRKQLGPGGTAIFPVTPSDSTSVIEDFRGFGLRVEWLMTHRGERARQAEKRRARTVKVLTADGATVQFGRLLPAEDVGPQYATVGELLGDVTAVYATVDNLTATATALPPGATPTVTVSGPVPNKVINIGVPRGEPGMGHEEGQQLLADSQAAQTSAASSAADAADAVTLAQQAQAAAYEVPDVAMRDIVNNPVTETRQALDDTYATLGYVTPRPSEPERVLFVTERGSDANDGLTLATAKATLDGAVAEAGGPALIQLGRGTATYSNPALIGSHVSVRGAGMGLTTLAYTGPGAAVSSSAPGTRLYRWNLSDLTLTGPGKTVVGSIGLDLDSVSEGMVANVAVIGFEVGVRIHSAINGGATYNRLANVKAQRCGTGVGVFASGSNGAVLTACRANACDTGVHIVDSNNTLLIGAQVEACGLGVKIEATSPSAADYNHVAFTRFENNTVAWETTSLVRGTAITHPKPFGAYDYLDAGQRTEHTGQNGSTRNYQSSRAQDPSGSWLWERAAHGGNETPAFVVRDSNTSVGTPITYQAETERPTGSFYRGRRGGVTFFDADARGRVYLNNTPITPGAPASGGRLFVEGGALKYIGSSGTVTTIAPA